MQIIPGKLDTNTPSEIDRKQKNLSDFLSNVSSIGLKCLATYVATRTICCMSFVSDSLPLSNNNVAIGVTTIALATLYIRERVKKSLPIKKGTGSLGQKITGIYIKNRVTKQRSEYYNHIESVKRGEVPPEKAAWQTPFAEYHPTTYTHPSVYNCETQISAPWAAPNNRVEAWSHTYDSCQDCFLFEDPITKEQYPKNPLGRTGVEGRGLLGNWGPNKAVDMCMTRVHEGRLQVALGLRIHDPIPTWGIVGGGMRDKMVDSTGNFIKETTESGHSRVILEHASVAGKRELFEEGVNLKKMTPEELEEKYSAATELFTGVYASKELRGIPIFNQDEKGEIVQTAQHLKTKQNKEISDLPDDRQEKICLHMAIQRAIFSKFIESGFAPKIWEGVVDDPRNTDDSWMESELIDFNFDRIEELFGPSVKKVISLSGGDDIGADIIWADAEEVANRTWVHPLWKENQEAIVNMVDHKTGQPVCKSIPFHGTFASHHEMIGKLVDQHYKNI
ncbi:MAG: hypothetical protein ACOYK9_04615 [Chlamydiia bacterium]